MLRMHLEEPARRLTEQQRGVAACGCRIHTTGGRVADANIFISALQSFALPRRRPSAVERLHLLQPYLQRRRPSRSPPSFLPPSLPLLVCCRRPCSSRGMQTEEHAPDAAAALRDPAEGFSPVKHAALHDIEAAGAVLFDLVPDKVRAMPAAPDVHALDCRRRCVLIPPQIGRASCRERVYVLV